MAPELTGEQQTLLDEMIGWVDRCDRSGRRQYTDRWVHQYDLWRSYRGTRRAWREARTQRDRDEVLLDTKRDWGADLTIPWIFWTIETILPRIITRRPRGYVRPDEPDSPEVLVEENAQNMKYLVDRQFEQIKYELVGQSTARKGLTFGLGVEKVGWLQKWQMKTRNVPVLPGADAYRPQTEKVLVFDDPNVTDVDIFDFYWDLMAKDMATCRRAMHRVWMDHKQLWGRLQTSWRAMSLTLEDVLSSGMEGADADRWADRMRARGLSNIDKRGEQLHEVWEIHEASRVVVIVDRQWVVYVGPNPAWHGRLPFHIYRPTEAPDELVGISESEQLEDLWDEMNTMRGQRRDNATLKLMQAYAYDMRRVDPKNIKFGPGMLIGVNGDPSGILQPIQVGDIPFSSYREEESMAADIERISGISSAMTGADPGGGTATEAQLATTAANVRLQMKADRFVLECVSGVAGDFIDLNQQRIVTNRDPIPIEPEPGGWSADRRWAWRPIGPKHLAGRMRWVADGSLEPDNPGQKFQRAQLLGTLLPIMGQAGVQMKPVMARLLDDLGFANVPELLAPDQTVPPETLQILRDQIVQYGGDPGATEQMILAAVNEARAMRQGGAPGGAPVAPGGPTAEPPQLPSG